ncbi:hypothetical protein [Streptomyces sp. NPDC005374]|uniref:hypothetical protein n=1 Tax=Streptomyces sp. NPDC005374 TaxID=3364713 RepID=UPI0036C72129
MDAEELNGLATKLGDCTSEMRAAGYRLEQASVEDMGHEAVEFACGSFRHSWEYGIKQLSELTDSIRGGLQATAQAYSQTDFAVQKAMTPATASNSPAAESSPFG